MLRNNFDNTIPPPKTSKNAGLRGGASTVENGVSRPKLDGPLDLPGHFNNNYIIFACWVVAVALAVEVVVMVVVLVIATMLVAAATADAAAAAAAASALYVNY